MSARKENIKVNEKLALNESKNTTKFNKDNNNFNERTNNTFYQQQDAINKTLDNTLNNVKRTTDEATREILRYTQRIAENYANKVNNFTHYLLTTSNNALASNMTVYNTALEQTRDNLKACAKTNTNYVKAVDRQNSDLNTRSSSNNSNERTTRY